MAIQHSFLAATFLLYSFLNIELAIARSFSSSYLNRSSFPNGFLFGSSSAAYQYEGAAFEGGKGPSIWDKFAHTPGKIVDGSNGDVAEDFYHRYKGDVQQMKSVGFNAFRLSISWSRILPRGKLSGGINKEGIAFYNNLINELLSNGIRPFVTIFHWDQPQALEDEYSGFLSPLIVDDYRDFAELCFKEFGDRVKHWITLNEPYMHTTLGYDLGVSAPGRCSSWLPNNCHYGNSATEPYVVAHHLLLSHAAAVKVYNEKYKASQDGEIGITLVSDWMIPYSSKREDVKAAQRALDFMYGWFMHPLVYGKYPSSMRKLVGDRLPEFTAEQVTMLKGSFDFLGLNYYTTNYAAHFVRSNNNVSSSTDSRARLTKEKNGKPIGDPTGVDRFYVYPKGLQDLLVYTMEKYKNPTIYITENGMAEVKNMTLKQSIKDTQRVNFFYQHLSAVQNAIKLGVKVKGFFAWSFLDNFEWADGYTVRFGLYHVDYNDGLKRYPKMSALWFKNWLTKE